MVLISFAAHLTPCNLALDFSNVCYKIVFCVLKGIFLFFFFGNAGIVHDNGSHCM